MGEDLRKNSPFSGSDWKKREGGSEPVGRLTRRLGKRESFKRKQKGNKVNHLQTVVRVGNDGAYMIKPRRLVSWDPGNSIKSSRSR